MLGLCKNKAVAQIVIDTQDKKTCIFSFCDRCVRISVSVPNRYVVWALKSPILYTSSTVAFPA